MALSNDPQQRLLFVADGMNKKMRVLNATRCTEVGAIGSGGRYPGQFLAVNSVADDAQGNLYTGENASRQARAEVRRRASSEPSTASSVRTWDTERRMKRSVIF